MDSAVTVAPAIRRYRTNPGSPWAVETFYQDEWHPIHFASTPVDALAWVATQVTHGAQVEGITASRLRVAATTIQSRVDQGVAQVSALLEAARKIDG